MNLKNSSNNTCLYTSLSPKRDTNEPNSWWPITARCSCVRECMSVAFSYYVTIRNNYCLAYHGQCAEYVTVLRLLRPAIQSQLSDVAVFISCADKLAYLLAGEDNVIPFSSLRDRKNDIAHIRQIGADLSGQHPLVTLMTESGLKFPALPSARPPASRRCLICPDSGHPDRCLDDLVRPLSLARM